MRITSIFPCIMAVISNFTIFFIFPYLLFSNFSFLNITVVWKKNKIKISSIWQNTKFLNLPSKIYYQNKYKMKRNKSFFIHFDNRFWKVNPKI